MIKTSFDQHHQISIRDQQCPDNACNGSDAEALSTVLIHSQKEKRFRCSYCGKTWVAHRKSIWFGIRSAIEKFWKAKALQDQGLSVRKTAEEIEVSPTTIQQWKGRWQIADLVP